MLGAERLRKRFGAHLAVDELSFEIARGQTLALLGPNGAGKSTTIHMLVGALAPDSGRVLVDGHEDPRRPEVRRKLGLAPQTLALYPELSAEENLAFFARVYGLGGVALAGRVRDALLAAGLDDRRGERASGFSGGMLRRLNLAAALVHDPLVLLLDEPTAGVDPHSRQHLHATLAGLKAQGRTILYTTHHMDEVRHLCDQVAIIDRGRLLVCGTPDELVERHGGPTIVEAWLADGRSLRLETSDVAATVSRLVGDGASLSRLHIERPDLETVFLTLTGRKLRD